MAGKVRRARTRAQAWGPAELPVTGQSMEGPTLDDLRFEVNACGGELVDCSGPILAVLVARAPEGALWGGELSVVRAAWRGKVDAPVSPVEKAGAIAAALERVRALPPLRQGVAR